MTPGRMTLAAAVLLMSSLAHASPITLGGVSLEPPPRWHRTDTRGTVTFRAPNKSQV